MPSEPGAVPGLVCFSAAMTSSGVIVVLFREAQSSSETSETSVPSDKAIKTSSCAVGSISCAVETFCQCLIKASAQAVGVVTF